MTFDLAVKHFKMEEGFRNKLEEKINTLLDVSPSDASASSKITKTDAGYRGVLQVFSSQGKFIAETVARDLEELTKSLLRLMYQQLSSWRNGRFVTRVQEASLKP